MEKKIVGFILIHVAAGTEHSIIEAVREIEDVTEAYVTFGSWDMIVRIVTTNIGKLESVIAQIRKIPDVTQTTTLLTS
jgi:DNA-binding Lrp family transcriptional regulator